VQPEVKLGAIRPFAAGSRRLCYIDPRDPASCIKVVRMDRRQQGRRVRDENDREWRAYKRLVQRLGASWSGHLAACRGFVSTDLGPALVTELVCDKDGSPARAVGAYVATHGWDARCRGGMRELRHFLLRHRIIFRDVRVNNFLLRELPDGRLQAVLADGLGNPEFIPWSDWVPAAGRGKIARKWRLVLAKIRAKAVRRRQGTAGCGAG
jgi:hypothetical protein